MAAPNNEPTGASSGAFASARHDTGAGRKPKKRSPDLAQPAGVVLSRPTLALLFLFSVCPWLSGTVRGSDHSASDEVRELKRAVVANYAAVVDATYKDALAGARNLEAAVRAFLKQPSELSMKSARQAWLDARVPYLQSEAFRFYDGPIDQVEGFVNAWPLDENYVDYVQGNPRAGIFNAVEQYPSISRELILSLNEKEGEKSISTGFHA